MIKFREHPSERSVYALLIVLSSAWIGFAGVLLHDWDGTGVGGLIVGLFSLALIPLFGVAVGAGISAVLAFCAPIRLYRSIALVIPLLTVGITVMLDQQVERKQAEHLQQKREYRQWKGLDDPLPQPVDFQLHAQFALEHSGVPEPDVPEMDIDGRDWSIRYIQKSEFPTDGLLRCSGKLRADQAMELQKILGLLRSRIENHKPLCAELPPIRIIFAAQYRDPDVAWEVEAGRGCLGPTDVQDDDVMSLKSALQELAPVPDEEERVLCETSPQPPYLRQTGR